MSLDPAGMPSRRSSWERSCLKPRSSSLFSIITELMNQANGRYGPQPAPEDVIKGLPTFKMTKDLLASDTITDCAVCKDDFVEEEDVMK